MWEREKVHTRFWCENLQKRDSLEDQGIGGRIMFKWIFKKCDGAWSGLIWLGTEGWLLSSTYESSASKKCGEILD
jgi:hypothetical protein